MGGASGHLMHLHENRDLTFGELKDVLHAASEGKLQQASEKLDGLNVVFTWNDGVGDIRLARSGGDITSGGMDEAQLALKFEGRGTLADAFVGAFKVLRDAVGSLPPGVRLDAFGSDGDVWFSAEVVYSQNPNVINYDGNYVIFHGTPTFRIIDGEVQKTEHHTGVEALAANIDSMQKALTQKSWRLAGPVLVNLKALSDGSVLSIAVNRIDNAAREQGCDDASTLHDYLRAALHDEASQVMLTGDVGRDCVDRALGEEGSPTLPDIKKTVSGETYQRVNLFVKASPTLIKRAMVPIEDAVNDFAIELLKGMQSVLVGNRDAEVLRLKSQVSHAVSAIRASGNAQAMDVLNRQMQKLGSIDNVTAALEGVVFVYKGKAYKFTGAFSSINQVLGLYRYGRGKAIPKMQP